MFERYSEPARHVILYSRYMAHEVGSPEIETEHLLLGLLSADMVLARRFLRSPWAAEEIWPEIERRKPVRSITPGTADLPLSTTAKRVLLLAAEEADQLSSKKIRPEHLLLGLLRDEECNTRAAMRLFNIDPVSGMLTEDPNGVFTYPLNGPCVAHFPGSLQIAGFNPSGSRLYEYWSCSYPGNTGALYPYTQRVNQLTGALGPVVLNLKKDESDSSEDRIYYTPKSLLDFNINAVGPPGSNSLNVYPLSGGSTPSFTCTTSMLVACGYGLSAIPDLSGNFVFLNLNDSDTQIAQVDLTAKTVTDSGYHVSGSRQYFSPDDLLVYSEVSNTCTTNCSIYIYTFDHSSGAVTTQPASIISAPTYPSSVVPALRK